MTGKQKILVLEDDQYTRDIYHDVLTEAGFEVTTAVDGEEGLVKIKEGGYNLILLDMMMPKVNGLEVLEKLKADPETKKIPIVMLTNLAGEKDAR